MAVLEVMVPMDYSLSRTERDRDPKANIFLRDEKLFQENSA
jgi:hypothetical protein